MKLSVLGSGSSGNAIFVESKDIRVLVDVGFSCKKMEEKLAKIDVCPKTISALLITHEHSDHIGGAGIFSRKYDVPIYITEKSFEAGKEKIGKVKDENIKIITKDFKICDTLDISPFEVMHDAEQTIGYEIRNSEGKKITLATDIGYITNGVKERFKGSDVILIESNYDYNMLMNGPYPWELKNRVKGKNGHLSNHDCAKFIESIYHDFLQKVYLVHISKDNNTYNTAHRAVKEHLKAEGISIDIEVAEQEKTTEIFYVR